MKKLLMLLFAFQMSAQITTVVIHNPPEAQINVYYVSQGFTSASMQTFRNYVDSLKTYIFSQSPYNTSDVQSRFKFIRVEIPSASDHSPAAYFQFDHLGATTPCDLDLYICPPNCPTSDPEYLQYQSAECYGDFKARMDNLANPTNLPGWNSKSYIIAVFNNNYYTGGGGKYTFVSTFDCSPLASRQVALHEFGHTFSLLGDEYEASNTVPYRHNADCTITTDGSGNPIPLSPGDFTLFHNRNVTPFTALADIPWNYKIIAGTAIPTCNTDANPHSCSASGTLPTCSYTGIGLFEGATYSTTADKWYRPATTCRMRCITSQYCAVCEDLIKERIEEHLCYATNDVTVDFVDRHQYITHWRKAQTTLTSTSDIGNKITVDFVSGNTILLTDGFVAYAGCDFLANIGDCSTVELHNTYRPAGDGTTTTIAPLITASGSVKASAKLTVNPNPATDAMDVSIENSHMKTIVLTSMDGKTVYRESVPGLQSYNLQTQHYPKGMYLLTVETDTGNVLTQKVVLN